MARAPVTLLTVFYTWPHHTVLFPTHHCGVFNLFFSDGHCRVAHHFSNVLIQFFEGFISFFVFHVSALTHTHTAPSHPSLQSNSTLAVNLPPSCQWTSPPPSPLPGKCPAMVQCSWTCLCTFLCTRSCISRAVHLLVFGLFFRKFTPNFLYTNLEQTKINGFAAKNKSQQNSFELRNLVWALSWLVICGYDGFKNLDNAHSVPKSSSDYGICFK